ncbi:RagB/SusD family nutrient uptake outer membrane protein [Chitinophaga sp.]|uniref:RagB/SusD family nutrient uptake outer membrane protein n=1 Tax=Chitinophaga sp. TaxID=1869181 RepID=UPI0031E45E55
MQRIIILLTAASLLFGCSKDYLSKLPKDTLSPETFYANGDNLKIALIGIYDALQSENNFGKLPDLEGITDNGVHFKYETELISFAQGITNANSTQRFATYYQSAYQLIQRANLVLDNIHAPGNVITAADRIAIKAEARALRALAYMRLVYLYGDVPFYTTNIDLATSKELSRTNRDTVINFILGEFQSAADSLSIKPYNNEKGRLTKQAVLALKARCMLYEARMQHQSWASAWTAIQQALTTADAAGNGLNSTFESTFTIANIDNKEMLFACKGNDLDKMANIYTFFAAGGGNLSLSVHTNLVNDFYCTDGLPVNSSPLYNAASPYNNRDPRLKASISTPGDTYSTGTQLLAFNGHTTIGVLQTNFAMKKFTTINGLAQNQGQLDFPVIRYADLLLMAAEAENEVNGPTANAYAAINKVRARAGMPVVTTGLSANLFRQEVIHERRIEFAFEGLRWFDLVTLGIADSVINNIGELNRKFVSHQQELFPIPQSERDLNPNLTQNPGY